MEIFKDSRKAFTITWKIKNFSFGWTERIFTIRSPFFEVQTNETSSWQLQVSPPVGTNWIYYCPVTSAESFPVVAYEISLLNQDGTSFISTQVPRFDFLAEEIRFQGAFLQNKILSLDQDILTIRMKMWVVEGSSLVAEHVFAETKIEVRNGSSFWKVEKFSNLNRGETKAMILRNSSADNLPFSFNICLEKDEYLKIKVATLDSQSVKHFKCTFFILDSAKEKVECGKLDVVTTDEKNKPWEFSLNVKKTDILKDRVRLLPNDILLFQCDFAYSTGATSQEIVDSQTIDQSEKYSENINTLSADLKSLCVDPILHDTELQTATESFPAHSAILSARSPVFRAMFTTDMKEKTREYVCIDDLDANTVRRMLLFMYSDVLENLDWESAVNLYIASDKYDIAYLRQLCASFLESNLLPNNCCEILLLAHMHQDSKLKSLVQDFISNHTTEIITSEEWRILEKENPSLTSETLRLICLRNAEKKLF